MRKAKIKCEITPGMFSNERAFKIEGVSDYAEFFADECWLDESGKYLQTNILSESKDVLLIHIPSGCRFTSNSVLLIDKKLEIL